MYFIPFMTLFKKDAAGKLRALLIRHSINNYRYSIINLKDPSFLRILNRDKPRKDEVVAVKEALLTTTLEYLLKLHESQRTGYERHDFINLVIGLYFIFL